MLRRRHVSVLAPLSLLALACSAVPAEDDAAGSRDRCPIGGKCDEAAETFSCKSVRDLSDGPSSQVADLLALKDPIAQFILKAEGECPTDLEAAMAKLRTTDNAGQCQDTARGNSTALVSETSQVLGEADRFRSVSNRTCGDRNEHGLMYSLLNLQVDKGMPDDVELIGFDATAGVFNYYTLEGGDWAFHGNSIDMIEPGAQSRCAACHTGGGLIMKELAAPWVHWEGDTNTKGTNEIIDANADILGDHSNGIALENIVDTGNAQWQSVRMVHLLKKGSLRELLEPVFCPVEVNTESVTTFDGPDQPLTFIPGNALIGGPGFAQGLSLQDAANYDAALAKIDSRIIDDAGKVLTGPKGERVRDTFFRFSHPVRSRADQNFTNALRSLGIVDQELLTDIQAIDMTHPVFSEARCDLLAFVPDDIGALVTEKPAVDPGDGGGDIAPEMGNCCEVREVAGCSTESVQSCVCAQDSFCCETSWDSTCVTEVNTLGCGSCPDAGGGINPPVLPPPFIEPLPGPFPGPFPGPVPFPPFPGFPGGGGTINLGNLELAKGIGDALREGLIANLEAAASAEGTAPAELLANLRDDRTQQIVSLEKEKFIAACQARDEVELLDDVLKVMSWRRAKAMDLPVYESRALFPTTDLPIDLGAAPYLDLETCELEDGFDVNEPNPEFRSGPDCIKLAEVVYDINGQDNGFEWVKLYNSCELPVDLGGMSLGWGGNDYTTGQADLKGNVNGKQCFIVGGPGSDARNGSPFIRQAIALTPNLQNGGTVADGVALFDAVRQEVNGTRIPLDAVIYGDDNATNELLDSEGLVREPHVGNTTPGGSLFRKGEDQWVTAVSPAANACPDF